MSNNAETITKIIKDFNMKNGVLMQCFPGQGLVGRIAGMHLIDYFKAQKAAKIFSCYFPHLVIFQGELGKLVHAELWAVDSINPPLLILTGESQPQEGPEGMFQILNAALDLAENWGIRKVFAIGGFQPFDINLTPEVTGFTFSEKDAETLKANNITLFTEGRVSGAVGVLTALASERGMESFGLMGKVRPSDKQPIAFGVDPNAAKSVLKVISDMLGLEMDLTKMDQMISEIEQTELNAIRAIDEQTHDSRERKDRQTYYI